MQEDSVYDRLQVNFAIGMFVSKEISLAKAAQLAQKDIEEFMYILKKLEIPSVTYSEDMYGDDLEFMKKAKGITEQLKAEKPMEWDV